MNTNSNTYTVVYSAIIVIVVAAILAFAAMSLNDRQVANMKAETIGQILTAAKIPSGESNAEIIATYKDQIAEAYTVDLKGAKVNELPAEDATIYTTSDLKAQNYNIADGVSAELPVYVFKNGTKVVPIYGAGLWGPVWGYVAITPDGKIAGATFDHASETPGLGGKIKDDPSFAAQFDGKAFDFSDAAPFAIVKGGAPAGKANAIDAITGATMTSKGLDVAINNWVKAYAPVLAGASSDCCKGEGKCCGCCAEGGCQEGNCCMDSEETNTEE
ncbi:MAG: NADH:ubiquinone reductase (Na(+)-transporting) subunit C [Bacteroidales bacterium]|nr:NADH:ubiquinone reductase (Na(+)-transporting) subunit C [Candidatus Cryptobacteroides faecihippi]